MTDLKMFEPIYKIDKKIFKIYQDIKRKIIQNINIESEKKELKEWVELENKFLEKLSLEKKDLTSIIQLLTLKLEHTNDKRLSLDILFQNEKYLEENDVEIVLNSDMEKMITLRLLKHIRDLHYLKETTKKNIRTYNLGNLTLPQLEDLTDIYVNENYYSFYSQSSEQFVKYAQKQKEKVYAFNIETKKRLELLSDLDFNAYYIFFLDTVSNAKRKDSNFYANYEYDLVFMNKDIEKMMIDLNFDIELILWIISHDDFMTANRKFIKLYRSHISFEAMKEVLVFFQSIDIDKTLDNKFSVFEYSINQLFLKTCVTFLTEEDYKAILPFLLLAPDKVQKDFSAEKCKKLQKNLNL